MAGLRHIRNEQDVEKAIGRVKVVGSTGLYFLKFDTGASRWIYRYSRPPGSRNPGHGKSKVTEMGLGHYPTISLGDARDRAAVCRKLLANGINPQDARLPWRGYPREGDKERAYVAELREELEELEKKVRRLQAKLEFVKKELG